MALAVSLVLLGIYSILNPRINALFMLKSQLKDMENKSVSLQKLNKSTTDIGFLSKYDELIKRIPKDNGIPEFLVDIEELAEERDLIIISIHPSNELEKDDNLISFSIVINGDYESLLGFINELENHTRALRISRMELNRVNYVKAKFSSSWELVVDVDLWYLPIRTSETKP